MTSELILGSDDLKIINQILNVFYLYTLTESVPHLVFITSSHSEV